MLKREAMRSRSLTSCLALFLGALAIGTVAPVARGDVSQIVVDVSALRSDRGQVLGALYDSAHDWAQQGHEIASCVGAIAHRRARCVFEGVAAGAYAIALVHDENANGTLDRDPFGLPREGFAFSNDARPGLGAPSFDAARFQHEGTVTTLRVHARYGL